MATFTDRGIITKKVVGIGSGSGSGTTIIYTAPSSSNFLYAIFFKEEDLSSIPYAWRNQNSYVFPILQYIFYPIDIIGGIYGVVQSNANINIDGNSSIVDQANTGGFGQFTNYNKAYIMKRGETIYIKKNFDATITIKYHVLEVYANQ